MPDVSAMRRWWVRSAVAAALPLADRWVRQQERRILEEGRPLTGAEKADAEFAGVCDPDRVRVLVVREIPTPATGFLGSLARMTRFPLFAPVGMALGAGIYLCRSADGDRQVLVHELTHTAQYERFGGTRDFLREYLGQCLTAGYESAALEREANETSAAVCRGS